MSKASFPDGFIWGSATAAHQVEGGNVASDCWALEHASPSLFREPSGDAVDQYHRFANDMDLLSALGIRAYRFSIEWARVEPEQGCFSQATLDHYQRCIDACLERGIAPMPTFQHFTLPLWMARRGGFTDAEFPSLFASYTQRASRALSGFDVAFTLNELNLPLFLREMIPPSTDTAGIADRVAAAEAVLRGPLGRFFLFAPREAILGNGLRAHALATSAIKAERPGTKVGVTLSIQDIQAEPGAEELRDAYRQEKYGCCLDAIRGDDFVGVQTYTRFIIGRDGTLAPEPGHRLSVMGYEDRPQALAAVCRYVWDHGKTPIIVTENGWAGDDDDRRSEFVRESVLELACAVSDGVDVRGYFYWSLLDNFEWIFGYGPKFGLIAVDRASQRRQIKRSALVFGSMARDNGLDP